MILYPAMHELLKKIPNRYMLVNVAAKRARDIGDELEQSNEICDEKTVTIALDDIINDRIHALEASEVKARKEQIEALEKATSESFSETIVTSTSEEENIQE